MKNLKNVVVVLLCMSMVMVNICASLSSNAAYADEMVSAIAQTEAQEEASDVASPADAVEETAAETVAETPAETEPQVDEDGILLDGEVIDDATDSDALIDDVLDAEDELSVMALAVAETPDVYTLKIDYYYETGERIRSYAPYNGTYFDGDAYDVTIPTLDGYKAHMTTASGDEITDYKISGTITSDTNYVVIYVPGEAKYTVKHSFEQLDGSYVIDETKTQEKTGIIGEYADTKPGTVPEGYEAEEPARAAIDATGSQILVIRYTLKRFSLSYNTNGGTYIDTVYDIPYGTEYTISTTVPVAPGYKFKNWTASTDNAPAIINPGDKITIKENTTLYAAYDFDDAKYTIVYWQQDPNDLNKYTYVQSLAGQIAKVGDIVGDDAWVAANPTLIDATTYADTDADMCDYFEYGHTDMALVSASGSAVLNVYFDRKVYKLEFVLNTLKTGTIGVDFMNFRGSLPIEDKDASMTIGGKTYKDCEEHYVLEARLGQDISSMWPTPGHMDGATDSALNPTWSLSGWASIASGRNNVTKRLVLTTDLISNKDNSKTNVFFGTWVAGATKFNMRYWLQDGDSYSCENTYKETVASVESTWFAKEIDGFENVPYDSTMVDENGNKLPEGIIALSSNETDVNFYYSRNTYNIDYINAGEQDKQISKIPFGDDISAASYQYVPTRPASVPATSKFICWNTDPDGNKASAYDFTTMPASNVILYAIWGVDIYDVTFESNGGTEYLGQTVKDGDRVMRPNDPVKEGYIFGGWYTSADFSGTVYDFNTPITADTTFYAKWETLGDKTSYTINYWAPDGSKLFPSEGPFAAYVGAEVKEIAKAHTQYYPTVAYLTMKISEKSSENVFNFYYNDAEYVYYKVRYVDATTGATIVEETPIKTSDKNIAYMPKKQTGYTLNLDRISFTLSLEQDPNNLVKNIIVIPCTKEAVNKPIINSGSTSNSGSGSGTTTGLHAATTTIPDYEAPLGTTIIPEGATPLGNVLGLPKTGEKNGSDTMALIILLIITLGLIGYVGKKSRQEI